MKIELNLVKIDSIFATVVQLQARKRIDSDSIEGVLKKVTEFIQDNFDSISGSLNDGSVSQMLQDKETLTIDEFLTIRYLMALGGYDVYIYRIADEDATGGDGIAEGHVEFNVVDKFDVDLMMIPFVTKIDSAEEELTMGDMYSKIQDAFKMMDNDFLSKGANPIEKDIKVLKSSDDLGVRSNPTTVEHLNSIMEFLGKSIIVMQ